MKTKEELGKIPTSCILSEFKIWSATLALILEMNPLPQKQAMVIQVYLANITSELVKRQREQFKNKKDETC